MGRHYEVEIMEIAYADLDALSSFLAAKYFFLGETPSSVDAAVYAFLGNILGVPVNSPLKRHATALPNLEAYCDRMKAQYYTDA